LVEITPFYGIGLSSKLDGFSASFQFYAEQRAYNYLEKERSENWKRWNSEGSGSALTKYAGSWNELGSNKLYPEPEAKNSKSEEAEANSEAWHFKRSWKRKQKYSTASTSLILKKHNIKIHIEYMFLRICKFRTIF